MMMKIGNVKIKNRLFLAPLVDITDLQYRLICREYGAGMAYTEMLNIGSILNKSKKSEIMMKTSPKENPSGIQITGNSIDDFKKVGKFIDKFDIVDINCGCPSTRTIDNSSGSFLLKDPIKLGKMVSVLKDFGFNTTVKIRLGFEKNNVIKIVKEVEKFGVDAITVHARLSNESRNVKADWEWIKKVKNSVGVPVIGNGDIFNGKDVEKILDICDGSMIARGAIGDPAIFERILYYLKNGEELDFDLRKNINILLKYIKMEKMNDEFNHWVKRVSCCFLKGFSGSSKYRDRLMKCNNLNEIEKLVQNIKI